MPDYVDMLNAKRELFLQKVQELQNILQEMTGGRDFSVIEAVRTFNFSIENCRREMQIEMFDRNNKKEVYESNLTGIGILYFEDFEEAAVALQNENFLSWLHHSPEKKADFVKRIKTIEKDLLKGLFLNQEPISQETIKRWLNSDVEFKRENCKGSLDPFNIYYNSGFEWLLALHQMSLISLANSYAHKNKDVPEAAEDIEKMFVRLEDETLKFNHFIWTNSPYWSQDLSASYYNRVIDQLSDLKNLGDDILIKSGLPKEENLLQKFIPTARQTIMAADMAVYKGQFTITNQDTQTILAPNKEYIIEVGNHRAIGKYLFFNGERNFEYYADGNADPVVVKFEQPMTYFYTYQLPLSQYKQIDATLYLQAERTPTVPMETYVYENKSSAPYVIYLSQLPGFTKADPKAEYGFITTPTARMINDPHMPEDVRIEIPNPSVLLVELVYPDRSKPQDNSARICQRVIHLLNKNHMHPLAFRNK